MQTGTLTPAAQVILALIPVVGITFAAILVFFVTLWNHHEAKLRIIKGTYVPKKFNVKAFTLLLGMCLIGVGLVFSVMFLLLSGFTWELLSGFLPLVIGIAFTIFSNSDIGDEK